MTEADGPTPRERLDAFRKGLDLHENQVLEAERRSANALLAADDRPERVVHAAEHALVTSDEFCRHHLLVFQPAEKIACHAGCHWCCYFKVSATVPEIFVLARHLEATRTPDALASLKAHLSLLAQDPRLFSDARKVAARIPCALLDAAGSCSVHEARPIACRGWNAYDPEACIRSLDDEDEIAPGNLQLARECAVVGLGLLAALDDAALPTDIVELNSALSIALSEPHALERWLAGEPIFFAARADQDRDDDVTPSGV